MEKVLLFCAYCDKQFILGHIMKAYVDGDKRLHLLHIFCEGKWLNEGSDSKVFYGK